ncbi:MAG: HlyC/CorC family transporter [Chloroflexi bacterium]|nr:HlyC/CorC family transporter [Chloroflexota bacterium]MBV9599642.1 HlyC/CorC family transporter [Chloroflexota bacterium]
MSDLRIPIFAVAALVTFLAAAAQASLVYIDRARLRHMLEEGQPRAKSLNRLLDEPTSTLSTILVVYTLALCAAAAAAFSFDLELWLTVAPWVAIVAALLQLLVLLLVQFVGRVVAVARPEQVALTFVRPVELLMSLFFIVLLPLNALDSWVRGLLGVQRALTPADAEDRLRHIVEGNTDLEEDEREMIASVIELGEQPVREIMVPRMDIVATPENSTVRETLDRIVDSGHSRIPIYDATIDNITGVVYAKDLLKFLRDGEQSADVRPLAREPSFVPETKKVDELLHEMQQRRVHVSIVVDEYGGTAGLITIEDLIEEIVGEIQDEYDVEEQLIQEVSDEEALFDARVSIRDVNDTLDLDIEDDDFDTLGGLLYHELGKVPNVGDEVRVDGVRVTVLTTTGRRVRKVRVMKVPPEPAATADR